jgi:hypothetical protein
LPVPRIRSPAEVTADQIGVHSLELIRRDDAPRHDPGPEARGEPLDARIDAVAELLGVRGPIALEH